MHLCHTHGMPLMVLIVALIGAAAFIRMRDSLTRFYEQHYVKLSEYSERATAIVILMQIILVSVEPRGGDGVGA